MQQIVHDVVAQKSAKLMRTTAMENAESVQALEYILILILANRVRAPERVRNARAQAYASFARSKQRIRFATRPTRCSRGRAKSGAPLSFVVSVHKGKQWRYFWQP